MHITDQRLQIPWQMKLYTKLAGIQFKVIYKPRASNLVTDALSSHPAPISQVNVISCASPTWLANIVDGYNSDAMSQKLLQDLSLDPATHLPYSLINGIIYIGTRI